MKWIVIIASLLTIITLFPFVAALEVNGKHDIRFKLIPYIIAIVLAILIGVML